MAEVSDRGVATLVSVALFAGVAWPVALVAVPPLQDLPGHLATVSVLQHLDRYPEYAATGPWRTNAALTTFCLLAGHFVGLVTAGKLFLVGVLGATALALPRFVLHFGGRRRMLASSLVAWPMVHNWFVDMGMLDFALSIPCAMGLLVLLDRQRTSPSLARAAAAAAMALVTWYVHVFALLVVGLMVLAYLGARALRVGASREALALVAPLAPAGALALLSVARHLATVGADVGGATEHTAYSSLAWQLYDLWAHWLYGFTPLSATSLVAAAVLVAWMVRRWRTGPALLGPWPTATVLVAYALCPSVAFDWGYMGSRFVPFVWLAALVRAPERVSRRVAVVLGAAAVAYWIGNGVDVLRLDREMRELTAGVTAVPDGARVAFLVFTTRGVSRNTWSLATAVGMYAVERHTNAPNVWANSASQPIVRRTPPERWEDPVLVRRFLDAPSDRAWADYWRDAAPHATHVLMWSPTDDARGTLPTGHTLVFHEGRLWIWSAPLGGSR